MSTEKQVLSLIPFDGPAGAKASRRTKLTDIKRENAYNDIINLIGWARFKYGGFPDEVAETLTNEMIERAVLCGAAAVFKVPANSGSVSAGMYVAAPIEWTGPLKADNTSDTFIVHIYNPDYKNGGGDFALSNEQIGDYVIIRNNFNNTSDYDFTEWTATMLNETDISEMQLIKWSRMTPIAKVNNNADISKIENILKRVYNGEPWAVMSDCSKMVNGGTPTSRDDSVLRLTDETAIEKMHFLSEFHYELIRRLCNLYNIPFHTTAKSAQNLESEIHNTDIFSRMLTENQLEWRRKSIKDFKSVFGWDITIELSDMFKLENKVIAENIESINPESENENVSRETNDSETDDSDSDNDSGDSGKDETEKESE